MGLRYYDEALVKKIEYWTSGTNINVLKPDQVDRLWKIKADQNKDKPIKLPVISIARMGNFTVLNTNKTELSSSGMTMVKKQVGTNTIILNAIPITVDYQLDIFTRTYEKGDEYVRNFVFNIVNNPDIVIEIPYNDLKIPHKAHVKLNATVTDNSDIQMKLFPDQFTRWTLQLRIEDAYLFSAPVTDYIKLESELQSRDIVKDGDEQTIEITKEPVEDKE